MQIIILLLVALALFLYFRSVNSNTSDPQGALDSSPQLELGESTSFDNKNVAHLSKGKLYCKNQNNQIEEIHSEYIQKLIDRIEKKQQQHGWKEGTSWGTTLLGGVREFSADNIDVHFAAAEILPENKILYFLKGEGFGGLFRYDLNSKEELRISHHH